MDIKYLMEDPKAPSFLPEKIINQLNNLFKYKQTNLVVLDSSVGKYNK